MINCNTKTNYKGNSDRLELFYVFWVYNPCLICSRMSVSYARRRNLESGNMLKLW